MNEPSSLRARRLTEALQKQQRKKLLVQHHDGPPHQIALVRELLWLGVPQECPPKIRSDAWKLLLDPSALSTSEASLSMRRWDHYQGLVSLYFDPILTLNSQLGTLSMSITSLHPTDETSLLATHEPQKIIVHPSETKVSNDKKLLRQIRADLMRTSAIGYSELFKNPRIQFLLTRVLYVSSIVHPASGYVQGMNDLLVPFLIVFLFAEVGAQSYNADCLPELSSIPASTLENVESLIFFVLQQLLLELSDLYVAGQPGMREMVRKITRLTRRLESGLLDHFKRNHVDVLQFAFRWVNCLLSRELPPLANLRLWDTLIAEGFSQILDILAYICAVFLKRWSGQLMELEFPHIVMFLQCLPTSDWGPSEIDALTSEAFVLRSLFETSPEQLENLEGEEDDYSSSFSNGGLARGMMASFDNDETAGTEILTQHYHPSQSLVAKNQVVSHSRVSQDNSNTSFGLWDLVRRAFMR